MRVSRTAIQIKMYQTFSFFLFKDRKTSYEDKAELPELIENSGRNKKKNKKCSVDLLPDRHRGMWLFPRMAEAWAMARISLPPGRLQRIA